MRQMHLLLIEDDAEAARFLAKGLRESGYVVDIAADGREGLFRATEGSYDLIVADRQLPHFDGLSIVAMLRKNGKHTPVLILSALGSVDDRIEGLRAGGDDYLTKPFAFGELLARLRALARRDPAERPATITVGSLRLDPASAQVWRGEQEIRLSTREFALLEAFMRSPGQVLGHSQLLDAAWDIGHEYRSNVIEVYIRYLREKIDRPFGVRSLETVRGLGYRLRRDGGG